MIGRGGPPAPPAQRTCSSESGACTSTTSSGSPGSSRVEHKVEQSESDHGSSKARGCSSFIMDTHSCDRLHGSISGLASPCPRVSSPGGASGFDSPHPSPSSRSLSSKKGGGIHSSSPSCICSCTSSSSCVSLPWSSEEDSSVQARRRWVPSTMIRSASWPVRGTKFANVTAILSSTQLRSLATPRVGTHSTSSLAGLYARMLPLNMRPCAVQR